MAVEVLAGNEGKLNCHECDDRLKEERGCEKDGIVPNYFGDTVTFRCPLKMITELSWQYVKAYKFYQKNMLPNGVAFNYESNKYLQAMTILDNAFSEINKDNMKKRKHYGK